MALAAFRFLATIVTALPPYMRRFVARAIRGAVAERNRHRPRMVDLRETFRITLEPVGSPRSLNPYPTCSAKVTRSRRTGPIFLMAIKALGAAGPCPSRF